MGPRLQFLVVAGLLAGAVEFQSTPFWRVDQEPTGESLNEATRTPLMTLAQGGLNNAGLNGVSRLRPGSAVTINGTSVSPAFAYSGSSCTATTCTDLSGNSDATIVNDGADVVVGRNAGFTDGSQAVQINFGDYYIAGDTTVGNAGTDDWFIEFVANIGDDETDSGFGRMIGKQDLGNQGWSIKKDVVTSTRVRWRADVNDGSTLVQVSGAETTTEENGLWFCHLFVDIDAGANSGQIFCNGTGGTQANVQTPAGDTDNTVAVRLGDIAAGVKFAGEIIYVAMFHEASWFPGGASNATTWQAFHDLRRAQLTGTDAIGLAADGASTAPAAVTRANQSYTDIDDGSGNRQMYLWDAHLMRYARRSIGGTIRTGILAEPAITNKVLQSEDPNTSWTSVELTGFTLDGKANPTGNSTADGLIADADDETHGITQAVTLTAATHTLSAYVAAGTKSWVYMDDTTIANVSGYYDLSDCSTGTGGSASAEYAEDWGTFGGVKWCRVMLSFTGTAAAHTMRIIIADADGDITTTGNASDEDIWVSMVQLEDWSGGYATSYVPTTTTSSARAADVLYYTYPSAYEDDAAGAIKLIYHPIANYDLQTSDVILAGVNDGGSANDRIALLIDEADDALLGSIVAASSTTHNPNGSTDVIGAVSIRAAYRWRTNDSEIYAGVASEGADTSGAIPDDLDRIYIGSGAASGVAQQPDIISDIEIHGDSVTP